MKKFVSMCFIVGGILFYSSPADAGCTRTKGSGGGPNDTISCSGSSCIGSRGELDPWVECDGVRNYCNPPQP